VVSNVNVACEVYGLLMLLVRFMFCYVLHARFKSLSMCQCYCLTMCMCPCCHYLFESMLGFPFRK